MKLFKLLVLFSSLLFSSCGGGSNSSEQNTQSNINLLDVDISGTWLYTSNSDIYSVDTDEFLWTSIVVRTYVLIDLDEAVEYSPCERYDDLISYGVKTESGFLMDGDSDAYRMVSENKLSRNSVESSEWFPDQYSKTTHTLDRISSNVELDWGELRVQGDFVSLAQTEHVCFDYAYRLIEEYPKYLNVIVPYFEDNLTLSLTYTGNLTPGTFTYEQGNLSNQFIYIALRSSALDFVIDHPDNVYQPESATIVLTDVDSEFVAGTYELYGANGEDYSGNFAVKRGHP